MLVLATEIEVLLVFTRVFVFASDDCFSCDCCDLNLLREGEGDLLRFFFASCRKCGVDPEEVDPAADELLEGVPELVVDVAVEILFALLPNRRGGDDNVNVNDNDD